MKPGFWTSEKLLSLTALMVSLLTLIVFIYQTSLMRQQQQMSVYPYLRFSNEHSGTLKYAYILANEGIGPAIIKSVRVTSPEGNVYEDVVEYVDASVALEDSIWYFHSTLASGRLLSAKEKVNLIELASKDLVTSLLDGKESPHVNTLEGAGKLYQLLNHDSLKIEIVYESVYGQTWRIHNSSDVPEEMD